MNFNSKTRQIPQKDKHQIIKVVLLNPNVLVQINDPFTTGTIYMPISLAYIASALENMGTQVQVIDAFGEAPNNVMIRGGFLWRGLSGTQVRAKIPEDIDAIVISAINITYYNAIEKLISSIKSTNIPIILIENTQAVTSFNLKETAEDFIRMGVSYVICGEGEKAVSELLYCIKTGKSPADILGIVFNDPDKGVFYGPSPHTIHDLDSLSFPDWSKFPLQNYWDLKYGHGPVEGNYLPMLTSRGCPYGCRFCVIPSSNNRKWRSRSPVNVVDEMEHHKKKFGVNEFHIEDLNPTVSDKRIREICREILRRGLKVIFKMVSGTKVETIKDEETVSLLASAGCNYISISPESGSDRVLKAMDKPFNWDHAVRMVRSMNKYGIFTQACFIIGFPAETKEDRKKTKEQVIRFTKIGIDEIAVFIVTPVPGSAIFNVFSGYKCLSELTFSPDWREDYDVLNRFRLRLYGAFLLHKLLYHPLKMARQPFAFLRRSYKTKMEMVPYKALHVKRLLRGATSQ